MITQEELGRRLKAAREAIGMTAADVGVALGVTDTVLAGIEAGSQGPNSVELVKLARLYGRGLDEFFSPTFEAEGAVAALFRNAADSTALDGLRDRLVLMRELVAIEGLLGTRPPATLEGLLQQAETGSEGERASAACDLGERLMARGLEAYHRDLISRRKLLSLAEAAGCTEEERSAVLAAIAREEDLVPAELPADLLDVVAGRDG